MGRDGRTSDPRGRTTPGGAIGVLDIGTSKICCLIASETNPPHLLGLGHQRARGIKAGIVVDMEEAEQSIRAAIAQAERQARLTLASVHVAIGGGQIQSSKFEASTPIARGVVRNNDVARLIDGARRYAEPDGRALIHLNTIAYRIDASPNLVEPRGMAGRMLAADLHAATAEETAVRNLRLLIERCYLQPESFVPAGIASARGVATAEELRGGVIVIDIGAGTTSIAVVADDQDLFVDSIPIGGNHLTFDIMNATGTPLAEAERIKVLYGTMAQAASDEREIVSYPRLVDAEFELYQITKAQLRNLIRPRVESLLSQAMEKLVAGKLQAYGARRLILTGGTAQLLGLPMFAGRLLDMAVRVAAPQPIAGMAPGSSNPAYATLFGLLGAAANPATHALDRRANLEEHSGYFGRMGQWLRQSF
jgi:cell division protein FtsA